MTPPCPVCGDADCHYWELYRQQTWHAPTPTPAPRADGIPAESRGYLQPIWRYEPARPGPAAIALDPREACWVIANGCTLDGVTYRASFDGWDGRVQPDGRVTVRIDPVEAPAGAEWRP